MKLAIGVALLALWTGLVWDYAGDKADLRVANLEIQAQGRALELGEARLANERLSRQLEGASREHQDAVAAAYERGKSDAETAADALVDDLRAGNAELRDHWQACLAADRAGDVPEAGRAGPEPDGGTELRQAGVRDLLRIVGMCEAQVIGLQAAHAAPIHQQE